MKANRFRFRAWNIEKKLMAMDVQDEYDTIAGVRFSDGTEPGETSFYSYLPYSDDALDAWGEKSEDEYILMQSTGLLDKNGVEIFEGDVVEWGKGGAGYIMSVEWLVSEQGFVPHLGCTTRIIGNRHENPELLEQQ